MGGEPFGQCARQIGPGVGAGAFDQGFVFQDLDIAQCDGGADRVARICIAMDEFLARGAQGVDNRARHAGGRNRQIARRQALGHRHDIGADAEMLKPEPFAQAAKAADHFIADQQDAIFAADRLDRLPISGGRDDHAARALHRFANERGNVFGADRQDAVLDRLRRARAEGHRVFAKAVAERIGLHHMLDARDRQAALNMHEFHAAQARRRDGRSVIGVVAADEHRALGLTLQRPVCAHQAEHGVVGFRPAVVEEHVRQITAQQRGDPGRQFDRRDGRGAEKRVVERQLFHLPRGDFDQFGAAIADIDAPQPGHAIQDGVPFAVDNRRSFGMGDDPAAAQFDLQRIARLRGQVMGHIELTQRGNVVVADGDHRCLSSGNTGAVLAEFRPGRKPQSSTKITDTGSTWSRQCRDGHLPAPLLRQKG